MQFVALFVIVICLIAIAYRNLRLALICLAGIILAALLFYFLSPNENLKQPQESISSQAKLSNTEISSGYADGFVLAMRVHNLSRDITLNSMTIQTRLSDCQTDMTDCLVIGEEQNVLKLRLPPSQARDAKINLSSKIINPLQGTAVWEHEIIRLK